MPDVMHCPTHDDLRRFLLGEVEDDEADQVEGHLSTCCGCLDTLAHLETDDALLTAMRDQAHIGGDPDRDAVAGLMDRLSGLHQPQAAARPPGETQDSSHPPSLASTIDSAGATESSASAAAPNGRHGRFLIVKP